MAVNWFKKKENVVDFRKKDSDMPIPAKMKEKLTLGKSQAIPGNSPVSSPAPAQSSGGFFSFFGSSNSDNASTSPSSSPAESKTDFWGNSVSSSSNENKSANSGTEKLESSLNDAVYKLSRITDRIELVERKIGRIERKLGIGSETNY